MNDRFFRKAAELHAAGQPFATATVVRVERPTSGKPGDRAIVTLDGELHGWVGGSCARPTVIQEALAAIRDGEPRLIRLSRKPDGVVGREGITDLSMTCFSGGTMEIYIEPELPRPRLLVVGDKPLARALLRLGQVMGYEVVSVEAYGEGALGAADRVVRLEEVAEVVTPVTYAVVATHGEYDELALERILRAGPAYVGLVASRKRTASIVAHLERAGLGEAELAVLRGPAGLDFQAREPEEIALSILAEIVQVRRRGRELAWEGEPGEAVDRDEAAES